MIFFFNLSMCSNSYSFAFWIITDILPVLEESKHLKTLWTYCSRYSAALHRFKGQILNWSGINRNLTVTNATQQYSSSVTTKPALHRGSPAQRCSIASLGEDQCCSKILTSSFFVWKVFVLWYRLPRHWTKQNDSNCSSQDAFSFTFPFWQLIIGLLKCEVMLLRMP